MTSEGLREMFEGDSADTCDGKFPLMQMGGRANGQACAEGERGVLVLLRLVEGSRKFRQNRRFSAR